MAIAVSDFIQAPVLQMLSNPWVAFGLRAALGTYIVYMARGFYADPLAYFRRWMPSMPELPWVCTTIRALACFCVWGGCFILASAIAAQLLDLHGWGYAGLMVLLAAITTYFLLPAPSDPIRRAGRARVNKDRRID